VVPCDKLACGIQSGAQVVRGDRPEAAIADVILARPRGLVTRADSKDAERFPFTFDKVRDRPSLSTIACLKLA
jgi:hypothetical protein